MLHRWPALLRHAHQTFFLLSLCCAGLPGCATRESHTHRLVVEPRGTQERVSTEQKPFEWPEWAPTVGR